MPAAGPDERRRNRRYPLSAGMNFYHAPSQREFPARSVDISKGGMLMHAPISTPLKVGQQLRLTVPGVERPEFAGLSDRTVDGTVVRVDRDGLVEKGCVAVGVMFTET